MTKANPVKKWWLPIPSERMEENELIDLIKAANRDQDIHPFDRMGSDELLRSTKRELVQWLNDVRYEKMAPLVPENSDHKTRKNADRSRFNGLTASEVNDMLRTFPEPTIS